ncbi:response regulator transcription factor [Sphingomonas sp. M1-B02]|uniref:response regulator transcription factor n=1 Tax=Sphingomonas sp. M1-B02 TaxID=3114300 RepID=UPI0022409BED|nr:response regulator [Sphingomonas sp. S6-11]UZK66308.1 response regulator [Sphingomonas sp. S6-11]
MSASQPALAAMAAPEPVASLAIVVDDDKDLRDGLANLFRSVGQEAALFASPAEFLEARLPNVPSCLLLDIRLQGGSGFDLQLHLKRIGATVPVIFMTGHGDIAMGVRAMKAGALDFLTKPFRDQELLDVVAEAIDRDRRRRRADEALGTLRSLYDGLTPREKEVMRYVVSGLLNKQIAGEMGLQEITVKIHRGNMMRKMEMRCVADLVRAAESLGLYKFRGVHE